MVEALRGLTGLVILSPDDGPEVRETLGGFAIEEVAMRYSASARATRRETELLVSM